MTSESDTRVSDAYREAAAEKAPEHLNQAILAQAARAARPRYARSRAWTRPLAWAATIVLSVAIVLELTQDAVLDGPPADVATPAGAADAAAESKFERQDRPAEALEEAPAALPNTVPMRVEQVQTEIVPTGRLRESRGAPAQITADDFELHDKDLLKSAEEAAALRQDDARAAAPAMLRSTAAPACPEEVMQRPESWLECIERLEQEGRVDEAGRQRQLLAEAFPDFEPT